MSVYQVASGPLLRCYSREATRLGWTCSRGNLRRLPLLIYRLHGCVFRMIYINSIFRISIRLFLSGWRNDQFLKLLLLSLVTIEVGISTGEILNIGMQVATRPVLRKPLFTITHGVVIFSFFHNVAFTEPALIVNRHESSVRFIDNYGVCAR